MTGGSDLRRPVDVVIVNWETRDLLDPCLEAVFAGADADLVDEVLVVDNGSTDGSAEHVERHWPQVTLLRNERNVGYTRANNQALARCGAPFVLLLNTDAILRPGALRAMSERMAADDGCGVVGPRLEYGDGSWQRWTAGRAPTLGSALTYFLFLDRLPRLRLQGLYLGADVTRPLPRDWVSSACMLVRRSVLDGLGGLDESFFCYMDDVDLCQRARDAGWSVWYDPTVTVTHLMGQSTLRRTGAASPLALHSFNRYFARRHGRRSATALRAVQVAGFGLRAALYAGRGAAARTHHDASWAAARAHWRNLNTCLEVDDARVGR